MSTERRAEERKKPGEGMDVDYLDAISEIGAVSRGESHANFNEAVFEFINIMCEEIEDMYYDAISGEVLEGERTREARKVHMETFREHGVCEKVPIQERLKNTGKSLAGVKLVDTSRQREPRAQV